MMRSIHSILMLTCLLGAHRADALCRPSVAHFMRHHERFLEPRVEGEGRTESVLRRYGLDRSAELPLFLRQNGFSPDLVAVTQLTYSWQSAFPVIEFFNTQILYYDYTSPGGVELLEKLDKLDGTGLCPREVLVMSHGPAPPCTCPPPINPACQYAYYVDVMARALGYTGPIIESLCEFGRLYTLRVIPGGTNSTIETRIRYDNPLEEWPPTPLNCAVPGAVPKPEKIFEEA